MILYTSDLHLGHRNVIRFDNRPFVDREEMDRILVYLWNGRVQKDDDVYILGDFCYRSDKTPETYLRKLTGRKHLVIGNHDDDLLKNEKAMAYFETVEHLQNINDTYQGETIQVCLSHFPMAEWRAYHRGSWHVHGHIHNRKDEAYELMKSRRHALNAGCMINNYMPVSFRELIENNERFRTMDKILL